MGKPVIRMGARAVLAWAAALLCGAGMPAEAGIGDIDPGYGVGGVVNSQREPIVLDDGSLLAATPEGTGIRVAHWDQDGKVDTAFGLAGSRLLPLPFYPTQGGGLRTAAGQYYLWGSVPSGGTPSQPLMAVLRLNADGSPDADFGAAGLLTAPAMQVPSSTIDNYDYAEGLIVRADGRILVLHAHYDDWYSSSLARMVRAYDARGSVDPSFGAGTGVATVPCSTDHYHEFFQITDSGLIQVSQDTACFLTADGMPAGRRLDASVLRPDVGNWRAVATLPGDRSVLAGLGGNGDATVIALVGPDGRPIAGFGTGGSGYLEFPASVLRVSPYSGRATYLSADHHHLYVNLEAATAPYAGYGAGFSLARVDLDGPSPGSLDVRFGANGLVSVPAVYGWLTDAQEQPDGSVLVTNYEGLAFRLLGNGAASPGSFSVLPLAPGPVQGPAVVTLRVGRFAGKDGAISIHYATLDGSAVAGVNYRATSGTLSWADGDTSEKLVAVDVLVDAGTSQYGSKYFQVQFDPPVGGGFMLTPTPAVSVAVPVTPPVVVTVVPNAKPAAAGASPGAGGAGALDDATLAILALLAVIAVFARRNAGQGASAVLIALACAGTARQAHAGPWDMDVTYGIAGRVAVPANGFGIMLPSGLPGNPFLVSAGFNGAHPGSGFDLQSIDAAGQFDPAFGNGGHLLLAFPGNFNTSMSDIWAPVMDAAGRMLVCGSTDANADGVRDMAILRYLPNGQLDASFGSGGIVARISNQRSGPPANYLGDVCDSLAVQADGRILARVAQYDDPYDVAVGLALRRFNADGSDDTTFGAGTGVVSIRPVTYAPGAGNITAYAAGLIHTSNGVTDLYFNADGTAAADPTDRPPLAGASDRIVLGIPGSSDLLLLGLMAPDVLVQGNNPDSVLVAMRVHADGSPEPAFGGLGTGVARIDTSSYLVGELYLLMQASLSPDGQRLYVNWLGYYGAGASDRGAMIRIPTAGAGAGRADPSFGINGSLSMPMKVGNLLEQSPRQLLVQVADSVIRLSADAGPSPGIVGFNTASTSGIQQTTFSATVQRLFGHDGAVSIEYHTSDGSAIAGTNYVAKTGHIAWGDGDTADKQIALDLLMGSSAIGYRFQLLLDTPSGGAAVGSAAMDIGIRVPFPTASTVSTSPTPATTGGAGGLDGFTLLAMALAAIRVLQARLGARFRSGPAGRGEPAISGGGVLH